MKHVRKESLRRINALKKHAVKSSMFLRDMIVSSFDSKTVEAPAIICAGTLIFLQYGWAFKMPTNKEVLDIMKYHKNGGVKKIHLIQEVVEGIVYHLEESWITWDSYESTEKIRTFFKENSYLDINTLNGKVMS